MGSGISSLLEQCFEKLDARIFIMGLAAAGKTTILCQLKEGRAIDTLPTNGFNVETVEWRNMRFTFWDVGSQTNISNWSRYLVNIAAILFVVDAADVENFDAATAQLHEMLDRSELQHTLLVVCVNKQDVPGALSVSEVVDRLKLHTVQQNWHAQGISATSGVGLYDLLVYLRDVLTKRKNTGASHNL